MIPYEPQVDSPGNNRCGAASLCMVYRSFGLECVQEEVWEKVARHDVHGLRRARTYLLAADALERGLAALVVQARQPWPLLEQCAASDVRIILNHRLKLDSAAGHYTVLVALREGKAIVHDPQRGPEQVLSRDELLKLWEPGWRRSEVVGCVAVAVARAGAPAQACASCGMLPATRAACPRCGKEVVLQPAAALGCTEPGCPNRLWKFLFCPSCDARLGEAHVPRGSAGVPAHPA